MLELSRSLSRPWTRLYYSDVEITTFSTTVPANNGASAEYTFTDPFPAPSPWDCDYLAHVSINDKDQIFIARVRKGCWVNPWHNAELVVKFPYEQLTPTVMNVIEFFLSWENRKVFADEYLRPVLTEVTVPKGNKKHWQFRDHGFCFGLKFSKKLEGYQPINLNQVKPMIILPSNPVAIGLDGDNTPSIWIPITITSQEEMEGNQFSNLISRSDIIVPGAVLTPQLLNDAAQNLVKNDSKRYLPVIAKRGLEYPMITINEDKSGFFYHPSVSESRHPRY